MKAYQTYSPRDYTHRGRDAELVERRQDQCRGGSRRADAQGAVMARYSAEMFKNKGKFWMALVDSEGHDETNGLVGVTKDCKTEADAKAEATRIWGKILKED